MALSYALAIPVGIAIGVGIQSALADEPESYEIVNGVFQALSAGMISLLFPSPLFFSFCFFANGT